jgi:hypothetical protein
MWMLPAPGAVLFLIDRITISTPNISGGSISTFCLVSVSFVCALSREVLRSAFVAFRVPHLLFISSSLDTIA